MFFTALFNYFSTNYDSQEYGILSVLFGITYILLTRILEPQQQSFTNSILRIKDHVFQFIKTTFSFNRYFLLL
jgi:hypothetical protein